MSQGLAQSARDVAVIGCVAVAACVGLFIWDGGSAPSAADVETAVPSTTMPGVTLPPLDTAVTTLAPAATSVAPPAPATGDVTQLPVPAGGVELPASAPGIRTWTVTGSTLAAVRDGYLPALTAAGWTSAPATAAVPNTEVYTITTAGGARLTIAITQAGADVQVVASP